MNKVNLDILFRKELENYINQFSIEDFAIQFLEKNKLHLTLEDEAISSFLESTESLSLNVIGFDIVESDISKDTILSHSVDKNSPKPGLEV